MLASRTIRTVKFAKACPAALRGGDALLSRSTRLLSTSRLLLAQEPDRALGTVPPVVKPAEPTSSLNSEPEKPRKKTHRFRNFVYSTTALLAISYGAGVYLSLDNDEIFDLFTRYAPGGSTAVAFVDDIRFQHKANISGGKDKAVPRFETISVSGSNNKVTAAPSSDSSSQTSRSSRSSSASSAKSEESKSRSSGASKIEERSSGSKASVKPAAAAIVADKSAGGAKKLPLIALKNVDPVLQSVVDVTNNLIEVVNRNGGSLAPTSSIANIADALQHASHEIAAAREKAVAEQKDDVMKVASLEVAAAKDGFDADRKTLLSSYNSRLDKAVESVRSAVVAEANNLLSAQYIMQQEQFIRDIQNRVETEREGRLAKLGELSSQINELQRALTAESTSVLNTSGIVDYFAALSLLQSELSTVDAAPKPLASYFKAMAKALPSDPLVKQVIAAVPEDVKKYGVLSASQLAARFQLLAPEIRKASLAPSDAGVAGHLSSMVASQLLIKKTGMPAGDDVESVLARTETLLSQGRVIDAVAEINCLQGWPRKIAQDWLSEGRKRGELEFVVNVLAEEGRLNSLSRG